MSSHAIQNQANVQIGWRQIWLRPVGPFDQTETVFTIVIKVFIQPRIEKLFRNIESIKIKVI